MPCSSKEYFGFLFSLRCGSGGGERLKEPVAKNRAISTADCTALLLAGLVTSADTGNEDLVIETRAALASFCGCRGEGEEEKSGAGKNLRQVLAALVDNLRSYQARGLDRVVVPTLEVLAFLFHAGALERRGAEELNLKQLCLLVQKAAYKTGNVRKLEACIKVYGGVASAYLVVDDVNASSRSGGAASATTEPLRHKVTTASGDTTTATTTSADATAPVTTTVAGATLEEQVPTELARKRQAGMAEARRRLGALMLHPWPRIRSLVVDELWSLLPLPVHSHQQSGSAPVAGEAEHEATTRVTLQKQQQESLLGVDWGKADKTHIKRTVGVLGLG